MLKTLLSAEVLAGNAAELSSTEMETTTGAAASYATSEAGNTAITVAAGRSTAITGQRANATSSSFAVGRGVADAYSGAGNEAFTLAILGSRAGTFQAANARARAREW